MIENTIEIDGVTLPYYLVEGVEYFPIKYMLEKVLLKATTPFHTKEEYKPYIKKCIIDWSFTGTVPQESNCMNKEGWKYYIKHCKQNKNKDDNKIRRNNMLCEYLGYEKGKITESHNINKDELYDEYINDCIKIYKSRSKNVTSKICPNCSRELPNSYYFFSKDARIKGGLNNVCRLCGSIPAPYLVDNKMVRDIYINFGVEGYNIYKKDIYKFYRKYIDKQNIIKFKIPSDINKIEFILNIAKEDYINGIIYKEQLNVKDIKMLYEDKIVWKGVKSLTDNYINEYCSDNDCKVRPYLYPCYVMKSKIDKSDIKQANLILDTYIEDNDVVIDNILDYNEYGKLLKNAGLWMYNKDALSFIVQYYGYEYAGYKFKLKSTNYYKSKENSIFDMKWFIEKDRKIDLHKIPLYITKTSLHTLAPSLYYVLNNKKCFNSLYEWIDACYPNMYTENDFDMNPYRCEFDSLEESQVHDTLINNLTGVIYNTRNRPDTVEVNGMIPDWIICNNKGCWLVEYFGLYSSGDFNSSHRLIKYHEKMAIKLDKYKELEKIGYKALFIYPNDIRNGFDGLLEKIELVK